MKSSILLFTSIIILMADQTLALETIQEKTEVMSNDAKRHVDKTMNQMEESTCMGSTADCLSQKAGHRMEESKDAIRDKASEIKNNLDNDQPRTNQ